MQLYLAFDMEKHEEAIVKVVDCLNDIRSWMRQHKLKLIEDKLVSLSSLQQDMPQSHKIRWSHITVEFPKSHQVTHCNIGIVRASFKIMYSEMLDCKMNSNILRVICEILYSEIGTICHIPLTILQINFEIISLLLLLFSISLYIISQITLSHYAYVAISNSMTPGDYIHWSLYYFC